MFYKFLRFYFYSNNLLNPPQSLRCCLNASLSLSLFFSSEKGKNGEKMLEPSRTNEIKIAIEANGKCISLEMELWQSARIILHVALLCYKFIILKWNIIEFNVTKIIVKNWEREREKKEILTPSWNLVCQATNSPGICLSAKMLFVSSPRRNGDRRTNRSLDCRPITIDTWRNCWSGWKHCWSGSWGRIWGKKIWIRWPATIPSSRTFDICPKVSLTLPSPLLKSLNEE